MNNSQKIKINNMTRVIVFNKTFQSRKLYFIKLSRKVFNDKFYKLSKVYINSSRKHHKPQGQ